MDKAPKKYVVFSLALLVAVTLCFTTFAAANKSFYKRPPVLTTRPPADAREVHIGNFGPTGLNVKLVQPAWTIQVTGIQGDSPAEDKLKKDQLIISINGREIDDIDPRMVLGQILAEAEATDGVLNCRVKDGPDAQAQTVTIKIPVLGPWNDTWPLNCGKTNKIVRANADYITRQVKASVDSFTKHNLYNGLAILTLLSTGEKQDLDVVRAIYRNRMKDFDRTDTGSHTWHNGYQGIAVCEYYLRTGDKSVMPLINAICESARKYQVQGGWTHWAKGVNPQYTGGGLMNAAGTQLLTALLLAEQCGAKVDEATLHNAVRFFYRFAGHGSNPYGDHRPEDGYVSENGKTEMLAIAMGAAARAKNGDNYARARDKCALRAVYGYPMMLRGHTGGGFGELWRGIAAAHLIAKKPELYRNMMDVRKWFYDLSFRCDGAFGISGGARYDQIKYGYGMALALTAPRKTLQITGAPRSQYAHSFTLPDRPWGRKADLTFFAIEGGSQYGKRQEPPHVELATIKDADKARLEKLAYHPEQAFREKTADTIREKEFFGLIEKLLRSDDPRARHTACLAINRFNSWRLRFSKGVRSAYSINPDNFSQDMLNSLLGMIQDPDEALWTVDAAFIALTLAQPEQTLKNLDAIRPWLEHQEWWLNEAAVMALAPALRDAEGAQKVLPTIVDAVARTMHAKGRGVMEWVLKTATEDASEDIRSQMADAFVEIYRKTPSIPDPESGVDYSGITSCALLGTLNNVLAGTPDAILEGARLSITRLDDMRDRELNLQIDALIRAADKLDEQQQQKLGKILVEHYRPLIIGEDPAELKAQMEAESRHAVRAMNKLIQIDRMAGEPGGWKLLGNNEQGMQEWYHNSFEPAEKLPEDEYNRYRKVELPERMKGWFKPEYKTAEHGWIHQTADIGDTAPNFYRFPENWVDRYLKNAGEAVFTRKTFDMEDLDFARMRLVAFARQGYRVYLNGELLLENKGRTKNWSPRITYFDERMKQLLKKGTNVIAATSFLQYFRGKEGNIEVYVEALEELPEVE